MHLFFNLFSFPYESELQCHQELWGEGDVPRLLFSLHQGEGHFTASSAGSREALTEVVWFFFCFSEEMEMLMGINEETRWSNSCLSSQTLPQYWVLFPYSSTRAVPLTLSYRHRNKTMSLSCLVDAIVRSTKGNDGMGSDCERPEHGQGQQMWLGNHPQTQTQGVQKTFQLSSTAKDIFPCII